MRAKSGYSIRNIAGVNILVPIDGDVDFSNVITLNETGLFIWECLKEETSLDGIVSKMRSEYDADEAVLRADVEEFISQLKERGLIEE